MLELSKPTDREEESCLQPHWIQCPCPDFPVKTDSFSLVYLLELVQNWPRSSNTVFVAHSHDSLTCLGFPVHRVHPPSLTNCPQEINKYLKLESSHCSLGSFNLDVPTSVMTFLGYASKSSLLCLVWKPVAEGRSVFIALFPRIPSQGLSDQEGTHNRLWAFEGVRRKHASGGWYMLVIIMVKILEERPKPNTPMSDTQKTFLEKFWLPQNIQPTRVFLMTSYPEN